MNKALLRYPGLVPVPYDHVLISFLPNKDRNGEEFDVEPWETEALKLQGRLFGGATSYPGRGSYRRIDERGIITEGLILLEKTRPVESFVKEEDFSIRALEQVLDFMKRFKKETYQESVAVAIDGEMYYF